MTNLTFGARERQRAAEIGRPGHPLAKFAYFTVTVFVLAGAAFAPAFATAVTVTRYLPFARDVTADHFVDFIFARRALLVRAPLSRAMVTDTELAHDVPTPVTVTRCLTTFTAAIVAEAVPHGAVAGAAADKAEPAVAATSGAGAAEGVAAGTVGATSASLSV